jgi:hypothetical protein
MELCKTLVSYGFELRIVRDGDIERVEAKRTAHTTLTVKASSQLLLQLSRCQDQALSYLSGKKEVVYVIPRVRQIEERLDSGQASELEEAALVHEWNHLMGFEPHHGNESREQLWRRAVAEWHQQGVRK